MSQAKDGDKVKVHYTGTLDDGTQFDSSVGSTPLEFTLGGGQLIPGFEAGVLGMAPGDTKTVNIPATEAYGPHNEEMVLEVGRSEFPDHINPEPGLQLQMQQGEQATLVTITNVTDSAVTLDANHPLAGQDLTFELELVEIG